MTHPRARREGRLAGEQTLQGSDGPGVEGGCTVTKNPAWIRSEASMGSVGEGGWSGWGTGPLTSSSPYFLCFPWIWGLLQLRFANIRAQCRSGWVVVCLFLCPFSQLGPGSGQGRAGLSPQHRGFTESLFGGGCEPGGWSQTSPSAFLLEMDSDSHGTMT